MAKDKAPEMEAEKTTTFSENEYSYVRDNLRQLSDAIDNTSNELRDSGTRIASNVEALGAIQEHVPETLAKARKHQANLQPSIDAAQKINAPDSDERKLLSENFKKVGDARELQKSLQAGFDKLNHRPWLYAASGHFGLRDWKVFLNRQERLEDILVLIDPGLSSNRQIIQDATQADTGKAIAALEQAFWEQPNHTTFKDKLSTFLKENNVAEVSFGDDQLFGTIGARLSAISTNLESQRDKLYKATIAFSSKDIRLLADKKEVSDVQIKLRTIMNMQQRAESLLQTCTETEKEKKRWDLIKQTFAPAEDNNEKSFKRREAAIAELTYQVLTQDVARLPEDFLTKKHQAPEGILAKAGLVNEDGTLNQERLLRLADPNTQQAEANTIMREYEASEILVPGSPNENALASPWSPEIAKLLKQKSHELSIRAKSDARNRGISIG